MIEQINQFLSQYEDWKIMIGIFVAFYVIGFFVFPIKKLDNFSDKGGQNDLFTAKADEKLWNRGAIMAQEWKESRLKWRWFFLGTIWHKFFDKGRTSLEIIGHEHEVQAAVLLYGADENEYRRYEAEGMQKYYYRFNNWTVDQIQEEMIKESGDAKRWVQKRLNKLRKFK